MSDIPTRRELAAWFVAFTLVVAFIVTMHPGVASGQASPHGEAPAGESYTAPSPELAPNVTPQIVYIATGANYPDALAAAGAAGAALGPVLLVQKDSIPGETTAELNRLTPNKIVIVGGTAVISDTVKTALEGLSFSPEVTRIAGANRYDTAAQLSASVYPTRGFGPRITWSERSNADADIVGDGSVKTIATLVHTTLMPGIYLFTASTDMYAVASGGQFSCWIAVDGTELGASHRVIELNNSDNSEEDCSTQAIFVATTAATYTVTLKASMPAGVYSDAASLVGIWEAYYPGF